MRFTDDVLIYDFEFNLITQTNKFTSATWAIHYNAVGTFEAHFPVENAIVPIVMNNKYLVIKQGRNTAIVTGKQIGTDFAVFGRTCNWILGKRITPLFDQRTGTVEELTRDFVQTAFSDVDNFVLGTEVGFVNQVDFWRNTYNPTLDVVIECLDNDGAGHMVIFDTVKKQWVYQILKGKELPLIISEANRNAYEVGITDDCLDFCAGGWYEKQIEQTEEETEQTEGETAPTSEWIYISGDASKTGIYRWECALTGSNESEAKSSLKTKKWNSQTSVKSNSLVCGRDYNLGDIVRVQIQKGQYQTTVKKRITGVNIRYAQDNTNEQPVFEDMEE